MSSSSRHSEITVQASSSLTSAPSSRETILQQLRANEIDFSRAVHTFQPSSARLRQAAAQALARSHIRPDSHRTVTRILSSQNGATRSNGTVNPCIHPQFRSKAVCAMFCNHCSANLCERGMRAILLGNTSVELFSTDRQPFGVALVDKDYCTKNCHCRIRDAACLGCGNVVGYHVTQPCDRCLEACNNGLTMNIEKQIINATYVGHFWMFLSDAVRPVDRLEKSGTKILRWSSIADNTENGDDPFIAEQSIGPLCR